MKTYCIEMMGGTKHFVNCENEVNWMKEMMNKMIMINGGTIINVSSISSIQPVKTFRHFELLSQDNYFIPDESRSFTYLKGIDEDIRVLENNR